MLNHHKKLKFGDTDIREIIQQLLDQVMKTIGKLHVLEKMKAIVGGDMALTEDVSLLPRETHVALKMLELELASFAHYEMFYKMPCQSGTVLAAISNRSALIIGSPSVILPILPKRENHH